MKVYITYGSSPFPYEIRTPDGTMRDCKATWFFARRRAKKIARMWGHEVDLGHMYLHDYFNPIQPFNKVK